MLSASTGSPGVVPNSGIYVNDLTDLQDLLLSIDGSTDLLHWYVF